MHRAALLVKVGKLNKAAFKALVQFGILLAHFYPLSSLVEGVGVGVSYVGGLPLHLPPWPYWAQLWLGPLYFSNERFYEIEGDASYPETPVHISGMEGRADVPGKPISLCLPLCSPATV